MKRLTTATLAIFVAVLAISSAAQAQSPKVPVQKPTVSFDGEGKVSAVPDQVQISCNVWGQDANGKLAREQQALRSKNVVDFLKKANLDEKNFKTTSYRYAPAYKYDRVKEENVMVGFRAEQGLHVCAPIDQASVLVDGLADQGLINSVEFTVSDFAKKREEAVKLAIDDAKAKAQKRATELGIKLGKMVGYSEHRVYGSAYKADAMPGGSARSAPALPAGESDIQVTVSVTYEIN